MKKKKLLLIIGTRPDAIKMAPLANALKRSIFFEIKILSTGQHKELLKQVLPIFDLEIDYDLDIMIPNQSLSYVLGQILNNFSKVANEFCPDLVLVHGDTTTALGASIAAFYSKIRVAHVEAGLRSGDKESPFPEEINRVLISNLSSYHFAPTITSRNNLINEGVEKSNIYVTGNTIIDALGYVKKKPLKTSYQYQHFLNGKKIIPITIHRRENLGINLLNICAALKIIAKRHLDIQMVFSVHPNPNVRQPIFNHLSNISNISLIEPLDYVEFVDLLSRSFLILTDSSGIQEEAPSLGKPVLLLRQNTERMESKENIKVIGVETDNIIREVESILFNKIVHREMSTINDSYGDGNASDKITRILEQIFFSSPESHLLSTKSAVLVP